MRHVPGILLAAAAAASTAYAGAMVTTGAGYIPVVKNLVKACEQEAGGKITESYGGNIGQMLAQVSSGGGVNVVITDRTTLERLKTPVKFSVMQPLGSTPLMLIWRKGVELQGPEALAGSSIKRIAHPDARAAVYGRAAAEWVSSRPEAFRNTVKPRLMQVSGVPQVVSYVVRGEVDAGFANYQAAMANKDKLGGMMALESGFAPIEMTAAVVAGAERNPGVAGLLKCLQGERARAVLQKAGIR